MGHGDQIKYDRYSSLHANSFEQWPWVRYCVVFVLLIFPVRLFFFVCLCPSGPKTRPLSPLNTFHRHWTVCGWSTAVTKSATYLLWGWLNDSLATRYHFASRFYSRCDTDISQGHGTGTTKSYSKEGISLITVSIDITICGWLGSKHQLTLITAVSNVIPMFTKSQHRPIISLECMPEYMHQPMTA